MRTDRSDPPAQILRLSPCYDARHGVESDSLRNFLFLGQVKRRLADGTLPAAQAFVYFLLITVVDNLQLAVLQVSPAQPIPYMPLAVWGSLVLGIVFLVATYLLNGGAGG